MDLSGWWPAAVAEAILVADNVAIAWSKHVSNRARLVISLSNPAFQLSVIVNMDKPMFDVCKDTAFDRLCFSLLETEPTLIIARYVERNLSRTSPKIQHMIHLLHKYSALISVPAIWHFVLHVGRIDIVGLVCGALRHFRSLSTRMQDMVALTDILVSDTYIDAQTEDGCQTAFDIHRLCVRAGIDAYIKPCIPEQETVISVCAHCNCDPKRPDGLAAICVRNKNDWSLILMKKFDFLFIWIALLFDDLHQNWLTDSFEWDGVPTIQKVLQWKEKLQQH